MAMESTSRRFEGALGEFLVIRDQVCRTPWCGAPVRHGDHVVQADAGGPTAEVNGEGLCAACNQAKEAPGWRASPASEGGAGVEVEIVTPTGHRYRSHPPDPPGAPPASGHQSEPEDAGTCGSVTTSTSEARGCVAARAHDRRPDLGSVIRPRRADASATVPPCVPSAPAPVVSRRWDGGRRVPSGTRVSSAGWCSSRARAGARPRRVLRVARSAAQLNGLWFVLFLQPLVFALAALGRERRADREERRVRAWAETAAAEVSPSPAPGRLPRREPCVRRQPSAGVGWG